jgi:hypothetical protein
MFDKKFHGVFIFFCHGTYQPHTHARAQGPSRTGLASPAGSGQGAADRKLCQEGPGRRAGGGGGQAGGKILLPPNVRLQREHVARLYLDYYVPAGC